MTNLSRKTIIQLICLAVIFIAIGCVDVPEFPEEPTISFNKVEFKFIDDPSTSDSEYDSLEITINFMDGNGDLGIDADDLYPPFNDSYYFPNLILNPDSARLITYSDRKLIEYDTLPEFNADTECTSWFIVRQNAQNSQLFLEIDGVYYFDEIKNYIGDTLYFQRNKYHNNFYIDIYEKQGDEFALYDFPAPGCEIPYNGRFPTKINPGGPNNSRALEGTLKRTIGMNPAFWFGSHNDILMLEIYIYDRAFNKSNVIRSPEFRLEDILSN